MTVLTDDEYIALLTVLQRAPLTVVEVLSISVIVAKLNPNQDAQKASSNGVAHDNSTRKAQKVS